MNTACSCKLEDLCRVCGCKLNKGSKSVRKQELRSARYHCGYRSSSCQIAVFFRVVCLSIRIDGLNPGHILGTLLQKLWSTCIMAVSPPSIIKNPIQPPLAATQILSVMSELECSICLGVLTQLMHLSCDRLVCSTCLVEWIHLSAARCPCCHSTAPLECKDVNPASMLIQQLLHDVMVVCGTCKSSMKAISYDSHCCTTVQRQEMQLVSKVLHQMLNANKENCIQIPTGGTVSIGVNIILNLTQICHTAFEVGSHIHTASTTL